MDFTLSAEQQRFQERVRHWVAEHLPRAPRRIPGRQAEPKERIRERYTAWQRMRWDDRMTCVLWPPAYGGAGLGVVEHYIVAQEIDALDVAPRINAVGFGMCLPLILHAGNEEQKLRHLPPAAKGDAVWCQLFSEPGCGSDLAALTTRAEPDGKGWRLTGQKIWTSFAQHSDWAICLARTDPKVAKHRGLTMFLLNMRQPGVTVRPIPFSNGDQDFNEVFLDGAAVAEQDVLGGVNNGWNVAISTLMIERGTSNIHVHFQRGAERVIALLREHLAEAPPTLANQSLRAELARIITQIKVMEIQGLRTLFGAASGAPPGPEGSLVKLLWSETNPRLAALALEALGPAGALLGGSDAVPAEGSLPRAWLRSFGNTLEAGSSEILRNIMAERILGLPKDASRAAASQMAAQAPAQATPPAATPSAPRSRQGP